MIYFDNAATTNRKPREVYSAVAKSIKKYSANSGRSSHKLALRAGEAIYEARERVARFFGITEAERVIFTYNATYALNIAIKTLIKEGCHIIISDMEHNSTLRPIKKLCDKYGCEYSVFDSNANNLFFEIERHIRGDTAAIISTISSNVTGREISLFCLSEVKKKHNLKLIVDASQAAGHKNINLSLYDVDAFAAPSHKALFGIMGGGFCIFKNEEIKEGLIEGGSGSQSKSEYMPIFLPEALEAGTLGLPSIVALSAGIEYINKVGIFEIEGKINALTDELLARLNSVQRVNVVGGMSGVISFLIDGIGVEEVARRLDENGICTRAGLHCAPLAHKTLGTIDTGTVRVSLSYFNKISEIDKLYRVLNQI